MGCEDGLVWKMFASYKSMRTGVYTPAAHKMPAMAQQTCNHSTVKAETMEISQPI